MNAKKNARRDADKTERVVSHGEQPTAQYKGNALVHQAPMARTLTRPQRMEQAKTNGLKAFEEMAELLSGENVTLPLMQAAYFIIDKVWKKPIEDMRKLVNESLKTHMRENASGALDELTLDYGGETYKAERKVQRHTLGNEPGMTGVKALAVKLGIAWESLCREVVSYEFDESKAREACRQKKVDPDKAFEEARVQKQEALTIEKV
jgi:hypothetical protein